MAKALTKNELLAKIDELQTQLGLTNEHCAQLQRELDAQYVQQRPSRERSEHPRAEPEGKLVRMRGCDYRKVPSFEGGRTVYTYKPVL